MSTAPLRLGTRRSPMALVQAGHVARLITERTERPVVASGGVSSLDDLRALAGLVPLGVEGAIVGKALYAGAFTLEQALQAVAR